MQVRTTVIAVHFATLVITYVLFESASYFSTMGDISIKTIVFFMSLIAAVTGSMLFAWKSGNKKEMIFAISTIFSFFLLIWAIST